MICKVGRAVQAVIASPNGAWQSPGNSDRLQEEGDSRVVGLCQLHGMTPMLLQNDLHLFNLRRRTVSASHLNLAVIGQCKRQMIGWDVDRAVRTIGSLQIESSVLVFFIDKL